jgi:Acetyltransferase (GNAT) domain
MGNGCALFSEAENLLSDIGKYSLFSSSEWFDLVARNGLNFGDSHDAFVMQNTEFGCTAFIPVIKRKHHWLSTLTCPYTCRFPLIIKPHHAFDVGKEFGRQILSHMQGTLRMDCLDPQDPALPEFSRGMETSGLKVIAFEHFGNHWENISNISWNSYLASRPGILRSTIRRKKTKLNTMKGKISILRGHLPPEQLEKLIRDYLCVYSTSWKKQEPFPNFNPCMIQMLSSSGSLRAGIITIPSQEGDKPIAAQIWAVQGGVATILKLAHDGAYETLSAGTVLTAAIIEQVMNDDHPRRLDFGRGDDPYKKQWTTQRTGMVGIIAVRPYTPAGLFFLTRHFIGKALRIISKSCRRKGSKP